MKSQSFLGTLKLAASLSFMMPAIAFATIIASDNFESYSPGNNNLQGGTGGTGWAAGWLAPGAVGLADVLDTTGNPLVFTPAGGASLNGATRALQCWNISGNVPIAPRQLATPLTSTFYVAYLFRYANTNVGTVDGGNNTFTLHLSDTAANTTSLNFGARYGGGDTNDFIIRHGTAAPLAGDSIGGRVMKGSNYLFVAKLTHDGSAFNQIDMWLDPARDASATPDLSLSAGTLAAINYVFFRGAANQTDDRYQVDSLILGTSWDDIVPSAGPPVPRLSVETKADGTGTVVPAQNIPAGNSLSLYAIARDGGGIFLSNSVASWSAINVTGGVGGGDIVPSADRKSAVFTAHLTGSANVRATPPTGATTYFDSGLLTVVAGPATTVRVETQPDGSGVVVPAQIFDPFTPPLTAYAITRDAGGNFLANVAATWSMPTRTSGVATGDLVPAGDNRSATFTAALSGTATIRASSGALTPVESGLLTVSRQVTWVGGGANNWDFTTQNWSVQGLPTRFYDQDDLTFDFGGSMTPAVNITTDVSPHSMNVTAGPYTFGGNGRIVGNGSVTNFSGTMLTFLTTNTYAGLTVVAYGDLQLGNGTKNGSLGTGDVFVNTGGTSPIFNRTDPASAPYVASNTISGAADFFMEFKSGATTLAGSVANSHARVIVRSGATLILAKTGTGVDIGVNTAQGGTNLIVDAGGKLVLGLQSSGGDHITAAGRYVHVDGTFDANGVNEAFGVLSGSGVFDNTGSTNAVLTVNQGGAALGNAGEVFTFSGSIRNTGTGLLGITKDGTNTLILANAQTYGGDTRIISYGTLQLGNVNSMQNSTLNLDSTGTLSFGSLTSATLGGLRGNQRLALTNAAGAAVALTIGGNGQTNTFSGVLSEGGSLTKRGSGAQTLSGANVYSGSTTVSQGTLLVNGALANGSVTVASGAALGGTGTIGGATTIGSGGRLAPGNNNIGKLTINNTVALSGTAIMEINGSLFAPTNCDVLAATTINLGGTLTVTNVGPALQTGDSFTLFTGTLSGNINPVSLPPLSPGLSWDTSTLNSAGVVRVTGNATLPDITGAVISGTNFVLSGTGGSQGASYYVLASTNVALPLPSWTRVVTNAFGAGGSYSATIPMLPGEPQRFYTIQIP